jgi:hypothetical protein
MGVAFTPQVHIVPIFPMTVSTLMFQSVFKRLQDRSLMQSGRFPIPFSKRPGPIKTSGSRLQGSGLSRMSRPSRF